MVSGITGKSSNQVTDFCVGLIIHGKQRKSNNSLVVYGVISFFTETSRGTTNWQHKIAPLFPDL